MRPTVSPTSGKLHSTPYQPEWPSCEASIRITILRGSLFVIQSLNKYKHIRSMTADHNTMTPVSLTETQHKKTDGLAAIIEILNSGTATSRHPIIQWECGTLRGYMKYQRKFEPIEPSSWKSRRKAVGLFTVSPSN
ncbi:hypothetical protein M378DRAFT_625895 [Amanita muscaria Koide BX008]|uniref:Uncharacterized protein n=1 Tax=Amanita muscaria (strain Koide BX008) TaxID=946122 RepID=A0A0C2T3P3_AMAMK|nr:hypothetical protein M378DRAFT_625895 [Amanita muscaria Koide BX008]